MALAGNGTLVAVVFDREEVGRTLLHLAHAPLTRQEDIAAHTMVVTR